MHRDVKNERVIASGNVKRWIAIILKINNCAAGKLRRVADRGACGRARVALTDLSAIRRRCPQLDPSRSLLPLTLTVMLVVMMMMMNVLVIVSVPLVA